MAVPAIHWNSEHSKPVFKVNPSDYWARLWPTPPPMQAFQGAGFPRHRLFKIPPTFLSCRLWINGSDPGELPQEPAQGCRVGLHRILTNFSTSTLCFLFWTSMAVGLSKTWKWDASVFTAGRKSEFCNTTSGQISPHATARGLNELLSSAAQPSRVRTYENWQLTELRAWFHYVS